MTHFITFTFDINGFNYKKYNKKDDEEQPLVRIKS